MRQKEPRGRVDAVQARRYPPAMDHDIIISGGGIAGLTAAAAFGTAGFSVLCVDPAQPVLTRDEDGADLRSTAFLQPAQAFLDEIGIWPLLIDHATPLATMRMVDAGGAEPVPRMSRDFQSSDLGTRPFGWNLPNWLLRREMTARLRDLSNVTVMTGTGTIGLIARDAEIRVRLSDATTRRARLVIAADGRTSPMRKAAGIGVRTTRFGQKALAFAVTHPVPHDNVSTEIHRTGGPFTLVPLPDHEGKPSSAIVWMEEGPKADALYRLDTKTFEDAMTKRSCGLFGPLALASQRTIWPIIAQQADRLSAKRIALVAEAAHVMPPIGAQGLNMSLRDLSVLRDLAVAAPERLGDEQMLDRYHRQRIADMRLRVAGIGMLNRISMASSGPLRDVRARGIDLIHGLKPVRLGLMRLGLGAGR